MQQVDDPPSLPVGTEVSAKYKGAFCEAKVSKVVRNIKVKVAYKHGLGSGIVSDDAIKPSPGQLRVGAVVEARHPDRKDLIEATVTKIQDCSQYTVVFDDGDITTLRRTALCLKSGRHFNESETLDQLPLTHPEHFGNPVVGGRRGRRRGQLNEDSSEDEEESDTKEVVNEKEEHIGKVVCIETESKKRDKEKWFPGLVVAPTAQATVRIRVKDEYLVRSFKDFRYYTVPKKEATEFTRDAAAKQDGPAVQAALEYLDSDVLPPHWDRDALFGLSQNSSSEDEREMDSDSSDDEPREEKDHFVAQLYKYMDDRGTPLNKVPSIQNREVDLYRLFRAVQKRGGYNRVTTQNQWKSIAMRLGFTTVTVSVTNLVKQAFKKFLQPFCEFNRKLGCSMLMTPRNSNRSKGRSLVRANSVASPKPVEQGSKELAAKSSASLAISMLTAAPSSMALITSTIVMAQSAAEESENTSESSLEPVKNKRKASLASTSGGKVKSIVEKYEDKNIKDEGDMPLSKIKAAAVASSAAAASAAALAAVARIEEKEKEIEKDKEKEKEKEIIVKEASCVAEETARESSPSAPSSSSGKKEKFQNKKPTPQSEEKRGKRKRDEVSVEKIDAGDFIIEVGDKLKVYYDEKKGLVIYEAKVIEITVTRGTPMYLVHYTGWNNRYDEWVPRERIAENVSKGGKQKGRSASAGGTPMSADKSKENPSKPPAGAVPTSSGVFSSGGNSVMMTVTKSQSLASSKRVRGRSDSLPPRSTTPSSVASNSSRTKSPASSSVRKRPTRNVSITVRRTSANVSDVSMPTESDTDSDEPVRRPSRAAKESVYKSGSSLSSKSTSKAKAQSTSAVNSQSDTDDDEDDGAPSSGNSRSVSVTANSSSSKGRDYDLNQIRSELKGFQGLKSPSPATEGGVPETKVDIKAEVEGDLKVAAFTSAIVPIVKDETKTELKEEAGKSSTDNSSETESYGDDDSQSSDKTTTLENMTLKFQQKINAEKQRAMENQPIGGVGKAAVGERVPRIVEKILKDSQAEKRQESLKAKPVVKEEVKCGKSESSANNSCKAAIDAVKAPPIDEGKEDEKSNILQMVDVKPGLIAPARFTTTSGSASSGKQASVIVEATKRIHGTGSKKFDALKKVSSEPAPGPSKKFIEPAYKEILKVEPPAACSPSSSCSSSSSSSSSSTSASSRSLPDMSKLDISGSSSSSSLCGHASKDATKFTAVTATTAVVAAAPKAALPPKQAVSPDIYEFKDTEPFEFEVRKSTMVATVANTAMSVAGSSTGGMRKQPPKTSSTSQAGDHVVNVNNPLSTLMGRKKRGSPLKELTSEKAKFKKLDENKSLSIVAEAKLTHNPSPAANVPQATTVTAAATVKAINTTSSSGVPVPPASNGSSGGFVLQKAVDPPSAYTPFEGLRKSPRVNLNMNALDEELAQTVQETTRALTDALQPGETTPTKVDLKVAASSPAAKAPSPTNKPATVGSPFIETGKDLSNVFELSFSEGMSGNGDSKDNRCELENAKILLSATAAAFDLEPPQQENKPTSIADKVLKAINQKKEAVENKNKEVKLDKEAGGSNESTLIAVGSVTGAAKTVDLLSVTNIFDLPAVTAALPAVKSKDTVTPIDLVAKNVLGSSIAKHSSVSSTVATTSASVSTELKVDLLESITVKNNDLSETIQKLECAIQRKTPVPSLITAVPSVASTTFYDDSSSSTDSERRLVIEDLHEEASAALTTSGTTKPQKSDLAMVVMSTNVPPGSGLQAPIPLKMVATANRPLPGPNVSPSKAPAVLFTAKEPATTVPLSPTVKAATQSLQSQPGMHHALPVIQMGQHVLGPAPLEIKDASSVVSTTKPALQQQRGTGVPIIVPDIPVSVLVAPNAGPAVVAAALQQQQQQVKGVPSSMTSQPTQPLTVKSIVHTSVTSHGVASHSTMALPSSATPLTFSPLKIAPALSPTGGYYLHSLSTDLRPDDGVKPILDVVVRPSGSATLQHEAGDDSLSGAVAATLLLAGEPPLNDSINLLCEETIPGSPAPAFGCKEDAQTRKPLPEEAEVDKAVSMNSASTLCATQDAAVVANDDLLLPGGSNHNSSPNDTVSQDESGDELKKSHETENEVSPRKRRRRTRKQSEHASQSSELPTKRRRPLTCSKKNTAAGSESDDNSDAISQRSLSSSARHQTQQQQHQPPMLHLQPLPQQQSGASGIRPCPYNFLVQLNPTLNSDQCIAILLKQIQDLRKTYNMIKGDLVSIDRRRKKMRRREREKKQLQQQQQIKIG